MSEILITLLSGFRIILFFSKMELREALEMAVDLLKKKKDEDWHTWANYALHAREPDLSDYDEAIAKLEEVLQNMDIVNNDAPDELTYP